VYKLVDFEWRLLSKAVIEILRNVPVRQAALGHHRTDDSLNSLEKSSRSRATSSHSVGNSYAEKSPKAGSVRVAILPSDGRRCTANHVPLTGSTQRLQAVFVTPAGQNGV